jgi:hypothetical protein
LAAGHAVFAAADAPAKVRACGSFRGPRGDPVGVVINRGATRCAIARRVIRAYFRSKRPCEGSACVREHFGWTCASAKVPGWPRLASCSKGRSRIAAYAPTD